MQKCQQFCCGFSYPFQFHTVWGRKSHNVEFLMKINICGNKLWWHYHVAVSRAMGALMIWLYLSASWGLPWPCHGAGPHVSPPSLSAPASAVPQQGQGSGTGPGCWALPRCGAPMGVSLALDLMEIWHMLYPDSCFSPSHLPTTNK